MIETASWKIDKQATPLLFVARRLKEEVAKKGGGKVIGAEFSRRTGLSLATARTWISELDLDLKRKLLVTARGTKTSVHLERLAVLMDILHINPKDEIVGTVQSQNPGFVYPLSE